MKNATRMLSLLLACILALGVLLPGQASAEGRSTSMGALAAGAYHSLFLQPDGTVLSAGYEDSGRCDVSGWNGIVKIACNEKSLGLRYDGTVMMAGKQEKDFDVSGWYSIVDIDIGEKNAIGLRADGTVVITGPAIKDQDRVSYWRDIVQVSVDDNAYYGLRSDGTVVTVSNNGSAKTACAKWNHIVSISAGTSHVVGLRSDGTVVAAGSDLHGQCQVSQWRNVVSVIAGNHHTVALTRDGKVLSTGENNYGQCDTGNWSDIVDISAGMSHTLALRSDGRIFAAGSNAFGQLRISEYWSNGHWVGDLGATWNYTQNDSTGGWNNSGSWNTNNNWNGSWGNDTGSWSGMIYPENGGISNIGAAYLNELPVQSKTGKLWMRTTVTPSVYYHTKSDHPGCWKDIYTPGYTLGPVTDNQGNRYTYGLCIDGDDTKQYSVSYDLGGYYSTFAGTCAYPGTVISDKYAPLYSKYFIVYGDGMELYRSPSTGVRSAPTDFSINIFGVRTLTITYPALDGPNEVATIFDARVY